MTQTRHNARTRAAAPVLVLTMLLGACTQPQDAPPDISFGHVHGLGLNPADDRLYVASHDGLFVLDDTRPRRVGQDAHDLMGFTITGPDQFLASGHPGGGDLPNPLGLATSDDGKTWEPVSLTGESDLHAIDTAGERVVAYDSMTESVLSSEDGGGTFASVARLPAIDVALIAGGDILITGADGTLWRTGDKVLKKVPSAPSLTFIDGEGTLGGVSPDGAVWVSPDGGTWTASGELPGEPQALTADDGRWFAATTTGLYQSRDDGKTWKPLL